MSLSHCVVVARQATRRNKIPLYVAAEKGYLEIARILLSRAGASDPFVRTKYGTTPMFIASKTSNQKMKALLLEFCKPGKKKAEKTEGKKKKTKAAGAWSGCCVAVWVVTFHHWFCYRWFLPSLVP